MAVFTLPDALPYFTRPVLTIGTFDGVHLGHQAILKEVVRQAKAAAGESVLITFDPHPRKVLQPGQPMQLLTPLAEKIRRIRETGIDHIVVTPFTREFSSLSATDYIREFLVAEFHPQTIIIGYDHRFGHDRTGGLDLLRSFAAECGYTVQEIPARMIEDAAVSSTKIRRALESGDVVSAASMLGRPYTVRGIVVKGAQLGRTLGYPTANLQPLDDEQLVPARGVYAVRVAVGDQEIDGMLNIGMRPTVSQEVTLHIEAHLFGFSGDLYGRELELAFIHRLRDEQKFGSLDALKEQLGRDAAQAKEMLAGR